MEPTSYSIEAGRATPRWSTRIDGESVMWSMSGLPSPGR